MQKILLGIEITIIGGILSLNPNSSLNGIEYIFVLLGLIINSLGFINIISLFIIKGVTPIFKNKISPHIELLSLLIGCIILLKGLRDMKFSIEDTAS